MSDPTNNPGPERMFDARLGSVILTARQRDAQTRYQRAQSVYANCFDPTEAMRFELEAARVEFYAAEEEANV